LIGFDASEDCFCHSIRDAGCSPKSELDKRFRGREQLNKSAQRLVLSAPFFVLLTKLEHRAEVCHKQNPGTDAGVGSVN
jgi:hypothetical protein